MAYTSCVGGGRPARKKTKLNTDWPAIARPPLFFVFFPFHAPLLPLLAPSARVGAPSAPVSEAGRVAGANHSD